MIPGLLFILSLASIFLCLSLSLCRRFYFLPLPVFLYPLPSTLFFLFISTSLWLSKIIYLSCFLYFSLSFFLFSLFLAILLCTALRSATLPHSDDRHPSQGTRRILLWWRITREPTCSAKATSHKLLENINIPSRRGWNLASWVLKSIPWFLSQFVVTSQRMWCL
jgi:hypothetical protein